MRLHVLNNVANDAESTQKIENYVKIASLKSETMGKLMSFDIGKPRDVNKRSQSLAW